MAEILRMPKLSDTMTEGVVSEWHKEIGDQVNTGDLLADIETDKATMEFECPIDDGATVAKEHVQSQTETFTRESLDFGCQAVDNIITAEVALSAPDAVHREEWTSKVNNHRSRYPGGTLPNELYSFTDFMRIKAQRLSCAEKAPLRCLSCGKYPWT